MKIEIEILKDQNGNYSHKRLLAFLSFGQACFLAWFGNGEYINLFLGFAAICVGAAASEFFKKQ